MIEEVTARNFGGFIFNQAINKCCVDFRPNQKWYKGGTREVDGVTLIRLQRDNVDIEISEEDYKKIFEGWKYCFKEVKE